MSQLDSFLEDLRRALSALPRGVADGAIQYYTEYFADARQAGVPEEEILRRTGSVEQVAAAITDDAAITAAENRPGPRSLLRTSRRLLGRDARQARSHRLVGVGRAARGTSLAFVSLFPLAMAILLYITAFALLAGTAAVAIALTVSLASHPDLAANDRLAQIGLIAGLAAFGLILTLLVYRAGHAFGRMTLALFRRIAARPEPAARAAAAGATDANASAVSAGSGTDTIGVTAAESRASAAGSAGAAASAGKASQPKPVLAPAVDAPRPRQHRRALWRATFILLLVVTTAGFTAAAVFGLPQAYFRLWNSQKPAGVEPVYQTVTDQPLRQITIVTLNSSIVVQPSSSRYIQYSYEQPPYFQIERTITDSSVTLTEKGNGRLPLIEVLAAHEGMTTLTVQVPVDPANLELTIRTGGGSVAVHVPSRTLKVRTGSGNLSLYGRDLGPGDSFTSSGGQVLRP